jgi:hypothetical protein
MILHSLKPMNQLFVICLGAVGLVCLSLERVVAVEFSRDVWPIIETHCIECHNQKDRKSGVILDHWVGFQASIDSHEGLVVSGEPGKSLLIEMISQSAAFTRMPLDRPALSMREIETLREWIRKGAIWPDDGWRPELHWAYVKPKLPALPDVSDRDWSRTSIDRFVLSKLNEKGLQPSTRAQRTVLMRRLSLDLTGLPPTVDQLDRFLGIQTEDAYEQEVDRLLASPAFGEKWARHWLDLARYADSEGYQRDELRHIWGYRDWVINALNSDLPFDQFSIEQLAGDLLPYATLDQRVATGFHRNTPVNLEAGTDPEADYHKQIVDRVGTTGTVWLGTTVACAQCHDHKYDPISAKEYYQLFAFFNQSPIETKQKGMEMGSAGMVYIGPDVIVPREGVVDRRREYWVHQKSEAVADLKAYLNPIWDAAALEVEPEDEGEGEGNRSLSAKLRLKPSLRKLLDYRLVGESLLGTDSRFLDFIARLDEGDRMLRHYPEKRTRVMKDREEGRMTYLLKRGEPGSPGEEVSPMTPTFLHSFPEDAVNNRLGLARWLVSEENPLVARVAVNRIWAELFGAGLVGSLDDFGQQGERSSYPNLLDWLAVTFVESDHWSVKRTIRRIVLSAVYQQQTAEREEAMELDGMNRFLWRHPGHRFSAETIRDHLLSVAGLLSLKIGGAPAYPWQPEGVWRKSAGAGPMRYDVAMGEDGYRRGIYTVWRRSAHYPSFANFDAPDRGACLVLRGRSNTPLQALTLLNDGVYVEAAKAFARRIDAQSAMGVEAKLVWAFRSVVARSPSEADTSLLKQIYLNELEFSQDSIAAWFNVASVLMNLHETICRN